MSFFTLTALAMCAGTAAAAGYVLYRTGRLRRSTPYGNPAPRPRHLCLPASLTRDRRVVIIGDVHGCADELTTLLDTVTRPTDLVLFVGDLVNKGAKSPQVLRIVQERGAASVCGNHDDQALAAWRAWAAGHAIPKPHKHGWVQGLEQRYAEVLQGLPFTISLPAYNAVLVHAGLLPGKPLAAQPDYDTFTMRDLVKEGPSPSDGPPPRDPRGLTPNSIGGSGWPWARVWRGPQHVFFGHDAVRRLQVEDFATGLDTGCVYGGQLTACVLPALDERGGVAPGAGAAAPPPGWTAKTIRLHGGAGLPATLLSLPAAQVYCDKFAEQARPSSAALVALDN